MGKHAMTLTLTDNDRAYSITTPDVDTAELVDACLHLLLAAGHDPLNVADAAADWGQQRLTVWNPVDTGPDVV